MTRWLAVSLLTAGVMAGAEGAPLVVASAGAGASPGGTADRAAPRTKEQELTQLKEVSLCDCLLPPQVRRLGRFATYAGRSRPVRTTVRDCEIRGGEYVLYDRADYKTSLKIWLPEARAGDAEAQQNVGEIYERGLGIDPDYAAAAEWYRKAAEQGLKSAQVSLGFLYERGLGVARDTSAALAWYRRAADLQNAIVLETVEATAARRPEHPAEPSSSISSPVPLEAATPVAAAPVIEIIEPRQTRGLKVEAAGRRLEIVGRVLSEVGIFTVLVDDVAVEVDGSGMFRRAVALTEGQSDVVVVAVDRQGARSELVVPVQASPAVPQRPAATLATAGGARFGNYTALIIANDDYAHLPDLATPIKDARAIADVLRDHYGFKVTLLVNATMYDVLSALNDLRAKLTKNDNLLIYYAGHGQLDEEVMEGYWLPVDAESNNDANWIPTSRISSYLQVIAAKQILIISDSCFSGALTRSSIAQLGQGLTEEEKAHWFEVMALKKARIALTSGGLTPVMDAGGGGHSVFNRALTEALERNGEILETQRLYRDVAARVAHAAVEAGMQQEPECAPIRRSGHEAGDFFFVPRATSTSGGSK